MNIVKLINKEYKLIRESEDYRGNHEAPDKESGSPLHNLYDVFGDDVYKPNASKYIGNNDPNDEPILAIIRYCRNKPNTRVKIYRAVPNVNKELSNKINILDTILHYYNKFEFFPTKQKYPKGYKILESYFEDYLKSDGSYIDRYEYKEIQELVYKEIQEDIKKYKNSLQKININPGDWVTISKDYAIEHGKAHLNNNYKILQKTVKASELYNEGYIEEWGYDPS